MKFLVDYTISVELSEAQWHSILACMRLAQARAAEDTYQALEAVVKVLCRAEKAPRTARVRITDGATLDAYALAQANNEKIL